MTPTDARDAVVSALTTAFDGWPVDAHGGRFTDRELALLLGKAPCLLVSILSFTQFLPKGPSRWSADLQMAVYVLGRDGDEDRATLALDAVFRLLVMLPGQRWSKAEARPPDAESITAENLYTGQANNLRVSLWAVTWTQTFTLEPETP